MTPNAQLASVRPCDELLSCSQFAGAWQFWPPRELLPAANGGVRTVDVPVAALGRPIVVGDVSDARSWSLTLDLAGASPGRTYAFSAVELVVRWRGQPCTETLPVAGSLET